MEAERVRLYAMSDKDAQDARDRMRVSDQSHIIRAPCKPLTPGAAVVLALFPDLDAAVAEELGRLVDVTLKRTDYRMTLTHDRIHCNGWEFQSWLGFQDFGRSEGRISPAYRPDPAAVCAAIRQVRGRISND